MKYKANTGLSRKVEEGRHERICEAGDTVDESQIHPDSLPWLLEQGLIEPVTEHPESEAVTAPLHMPEAQD